MTEEEEGTAAGRAKVRDAKGTGTSSDEDADQPVPEPQTVEQNHTECAEEGEQEQGEPCAPKDSKTGNDDPKDAGSGSSTYVGSVKVVAVQLGGAVSRGIASSALASAALTSIESIGSTAATTALVTKAQMQSMGVIALRLPLADSARMEQFVTTVAEFTAQNEKSLMDIAEMTKAQQLLQVGFESNLVATIAAAVVQQSVATGYLLAGRTTSQQYKDTSVAVAVSSAGSLAGGMAGAAIGTLVVPGAGTAIGSLLGSFGGAFIPGLVSSTDDSRKTTSGANTSHLRPLRCVEHKVEDYGEWLEIVDLTPAVVQKDQEEPTASFLHVHAPSEPVLSAHKAGDETLSILHAPHSCSQLLSGSLEEGADGAADVPIPVEDTDVILYLKLDDDCSHSKTPVTGTE